MLTTRGWFAVTSLAGVGLVTIGGTLIEIGCRPLFPLAMLIGLGATLTVLGLICTGDYVGKPLWAHKPAKPRDPHKPETF